MRLFVGLWPAQDAVDDLRSIVAKLRSAAPGPGPRDQGCTLRWTSPAKWHLTLAFLGETSEDRLPDLERRLARVAARYPPLTLGLNGGGRFGDRVLYTKIDGDRERLRRLAASVGAATRRSGLPQEQRPYRPHLTLARTRQGCDLRPLVAELDGYRGPSWTSTEIHLVHSHLGAGPERTPAYEILRSWPLTGRS